MNTLFLDIESIPTPEALAHVIAEGRDLSSDAYIGPDEETIKKLSLSACTARVLCLGYTFNNVDMVNCLHGDEREILHTFWQLAANTGIFVGFNILDFDLKFIWQRSIINRIKPSREIPFIRFRQAPVFDVMQEWAKWSFGDKVKLDVLARALEIDSPKSDGIDGSKVYAFYCAGRLDEIYEYCRRDVECVRQVYQRLR